MTGIDFAFILIVDWESCFLLHWSTRSLTQHVLIRSIKLFTFYLISAEWWYNTLINQLTHIYMYSGAAGMIEIAVTSDLSRRAQNVSLLKVVAYSPLAKQASMSATCATGVNFSLDMLPS